MRIAAVIAIALLLGPVISAQETGSSSGWNQAAGGPERSGVAHIGDGTLDILDLFYFHGENEGFYSTMSLLSTPQGLTTLARTSADSNSQMMDGASRTNEAYRTHQVYCSLKTLTDVETRVVAYGPTDDCRSKGRPDIHAYDAVQNLFFACTTPDTTAMGRGVVIIAMDGETGDVVWEITQEQAGLEVVPREWHCWDTALDTDRRQLVVPFHAYPTSVLEPGSGRNRVVVVDIDSGTVDWSAAVPSTVFGATTTSQNDEEIPDGAREQGFDGESITTTETGIVMGGSFLGSQRAFAWLDWQGAAIGGALATGDSNQDARESELATRWSSIRATSFGTNAAFLLGDRVYLIDPLQPNPLRTVDIDAPLAGSSNEDQGQQGGLLPAPKWFDDTIIAMTTDRVIAYGAQNLDRKWSWFAGGGSYISDAMIAYEGDLYVLVAQDLASGDTGRLVRLDLATGHLQQDLPLSTELNIVNLPVEGFDRTRWDANIIPIPGQAGALVYDRSGIMIRLGEADEAKKLEIAIDNPYPEAGEPVDVQLQSRAEVAPAQVLIAWGEGADAVDVTGRTEARHEYQTAGTRTVRVTALYGDGTTATSEVTLDVDGSPPPQLTWMQERFAPENLDMTWGVIGVLLVVMGAVASLAWKRLGRGRMSGGLRELAHIRDEGKDHPMDALRHLHMWHSTQEERLLGGRLTEDQFRLLENRSARLLKSLARTAMEPFAVSLSVAYRKQLEASIADGFVDPVEVAQLRASAKKEKLSAAKRKALDAMLDTWS